MKTKQIKKSLVIISVLAVFSVFLIQNSANADNTQKNMGMLYALYSAGQPTPVLIKSQFIKNIDKGKGETALIILAGTQWNGPLTGISKAEISKIDLSTGKIGTPSPIMNQNIIKLASGIFEIKFKDKSGLHMITMTGTFTKEGEPAKTDSTDIVVDLLGNNHL